jgi:uncharacterized protein (DUF2141 family)
MTRVLPSTLLAWALLLGVLDSHAAPAPRDTAPPGRVRNPTTAPEDLVEVIPSRLEGHRGRLRCLAFSRPAGFPGSARRALARAEASAAAGQPRCVFRGLPSGPLAISVVHDADLSGDLTTNVFGVPVEGYGFSRDARGTFGPPAFSEAAFDHDGRARTVRVRLSY